jgi:ankyrin repeat protein
MDYTRQQAADIMSKVNVLSNGVSFDGSSALSKAALVGQTRVVRELLQQLGVDIDWRDPESKGRTALHRACRNGHLEVVKLLVEHGASIEATDNNGMTPFLEAAGGENLNLIRYMEEKGSDINAVAADGRTVLHVCAADNSVSDLEHFLQSPKLTHSLSTRSKNGMTVLLCAVESGSLEATRFILERSSRSDLLSKTNDGETCLHLAVMSGEPRIISMFRKAGICHHDQTSEGLTALHHAAKTSNSELFRAILKHIDWVTITSRNPFAYPTLIEPRAMVQDWNGSWSLVNDFVSGRQLDVPTRSGKTALQLLLSADPFDYRHENMVYNLTLRSGIDFERRDREKKTPLIALASRLSNETGNFPFCSTMQNLLDIDVDRNAIDVSGRTALHYLCDPVSFSSYIFQAIGHLIGVEKQLADAMIGGRPPSPPSVGSVPRKYPSLSWNILFSCTSFPRNFLWIAIADFLLNRIGLEGRPQSQDLIFPLHVQPKS